MPFWIRHVTLSCSHCSMVLTGWADGTFDSLFGGQKIRAAPLRCYRCGQEFSHPRWLVWPWATRGEKLAATLTTGLRGLYHAFLPGIGLTLLAAIYFADPYADDTRHGSAVLILVPSGTIIVFMALLFRHVIAMRLNGYAAIIDLDAGNSNSSLVKLKSPRTSDLIPLDLRAVDAKPVKLDSTKDRTCRISAGIHEFLVSVVAIERGGMTSFRARTKPRHSYRVSCWWSAPALYVQFEESPDQKNWGIVMLGRFMAAKNIAMCEFEYLKHQELGP